LLNRAWTQPLDQVATIIDAVSRDLDACARATSVDEVFAVLEGCGRLLRLDRGVRPTMYRCATASEAEVEELRTITDVVRLGHVQEIGLDQIRLDEGTIVTSAGHVHVDCTAGGLRTSQARPVFEPGRIVIQQIRTCQPTFNAAITGYIEATRSDIDEKNALCPPNQYPDSDVDMLRGIIVQQQATNVWNGTPDIQDWLERSRLNAVRGMTEHMSEERMQEALSRYLTSMDSGVAGAERLLTGA
jgi:hypothetical protein